MRVTARRRWAAMAAVGLVVPLALSACGSSGGSSSTAASGSVKIYGCKPQNPLIPTDTNEVCGGNIVDALFTNLVNYNPDTADPINAVAKSITSTDQTNWDIKLNDNYTFTDGTKVTASSFVPRVELGRLPEQRPGQLLLLLQHRRLRGGQPRDLRQRQGPADREDDVRPQGDLADRVHGQAVLAGVVVPDPARLHGVRAAAGVVLREPDRLRQEPDRQRSVQDRGRQPDTGFTLQSVPGYVGPDKPKVQTVEFKTYQSPEAAYADMLANNGSLDLMDQVPPSALAKNSYQKAFPGRFVNKPVGVFQSVTLPQYVKGYNDPNLGKALSMAINRPAITQKVFNGARVPATGWVSPVVNGFQAGACDPYCTFNPTEARAFFAKATYKGPFSFAYNADGPGNKETAEAVCNSISNTLNVTCTPKAYVDFSTFRTAVQARQMTSMFRTGWQMDWPAMDDFLAPLYVTNASANDGEYSNKQFDALITKAAGETGQQSIDTYRQAEQLLSQQMAVIPLWYQNQQSVWSSRVAGVKVTPFSTFDLSTITLK